MWLTYLDRLPYLDILDYNIIKKHVVDLSGKMKKPFSMCCYLLK